MMTNKKIGLRTRFLYFVHFVLKRIEYKIKKPSDCSLGF